VKLRFEGSLTEFSNLAEGGFVADDS